ncbi:MAG: recombination-associated protein RdgC [Gammaproteobacteria bacterium]|nr:recombination-associated protein RdgC [Gammaproteobacteria bacterium]
MWFKQIQIFQLAEPIPYTPEVLADKMESLAFTPCLPSFPTSIGWASPFEEEGAPLVYAANGYIMLCMQIEDKILPATVVRQALTDKVKRIEVLEGKKVRSKDKLSMKDEIVMNLLPRAFSKMTRIYAYIDTKNNRLILGTSNQAKAEQFISLFKKSIADGIHAFEVKKPSPILTYWLKEKKYPTVFSIEKAGVLQDPSEQTRVIRCQQQDLFASSIQSLIKDGCEVKQLALCWHDRVKFVLADDFSARNIKFEEEVITAANDIESESKEQQFAADFFIMTETFSGLIDDLLAYFGKSTQNEEKTLEEEVA